MKILALEKDIPGKMATDFQPFLKAEALRVWELQKANVIREIYFTKETHAAVLVLENASAAEAVKYLATLPMVQQGLISFDLFTLEPYTGFERLVAGNASS